MATDHINQQINLPASDPVILETLVPVKLSETDPKGDDFKHQENSSTTTSRRATPISVRVPILSPDSKTNVANEDEKCEEAENDVEFEDQPRDEKEKTDNKATPQDSTQSSDHGRVKSRQSTKTQRKNNQPMLARLPTPGPEAEDRRLNKLSARRKYPPQMIRLANVSVRSKVKKTPLRSMILEPQVKQNKVVTWDQATNARPPLRIDMEGPGPCTYTPSTKPLKEKNSPAWTMGKRSFIEKDGGSRTSWGKPWFQANHPWHQKANFYSERHWPSPPSYRKKPTIGPKQNTMIETVAPSFQIGIRRQQRKSDSSSDPAPNEYNRDSSDAQTLKKAPAFSMGVRHGGSVLWSSAEYDSSPGPGSYNPRLYSVQHHKPSYTIRGFRRSKSHELGPFMAF